MKPVRDHLVDHDDRLRGQHSLNDGREEPYPHQQQERPYGEMEPEGGARGEARLHERQLRRRPRVATRGCAPTPAHQPSSPSRWRISQRPSQMNATSSPSRRARSTSVPTRMVCASTAKSPCGITMFGIGATQEMHR